jgi:small neutral amino acid transporter SnatA (MarC family)
MNYKAIPEPKGFVEVALPFLAAPVAAVIIVFIFGDSTTTVVLGVVIACVIALWAGFVLAPEDRRLL